MYLVDTNVLSHTSPLETVPNAGLTTWLERNGDYLYLSAVSITEVSYGIAWLVHKRSTRKADMLQAWLHEVLVFHGRRIIPLDTTTALRAGDLMAKARANGVDVDIEDAWIAAIADVNGMTVLTANVRHFQPMEIAFVNPFESLPSNGAS